MKRSILKPGLLMTGMLCALLVSNYRLSAQDLKSATSLTRSEAYDKADEMYKQLIQKEPGNSKLFFFEGENKMQDYFSDTISNNLSKYTREAKAIYDQGVKANANEPLNYVGLAKVAFFSGDMKTAEEMRTKARSFLLPYKNIKKMTPPAPEYAYILAKLSESYISEKFSVDTSKALPLMREALRIDTKNPDIYLIAGDIYNLKNDGSNAIKNYNLAQEYDPTSPTANMKIGSIYVKAKNLNAAIPYFEQAIALNANYAPAYRELGALYSMARRYDDARKYYEKYLDLTQGNIPAKISYVRSLYFAGEYDQVIKNIDDIFKVDDTKAYLNRLAGFSAYEKKDADYNKALGYMEKLFAKVSPELIIKRDYLYLARILLKKNQNYANILKDKDKQTAALEKEKTRFAGATAAEKPKIKPGIDTLTAKVSRLEKQITAANKEVDRAFGEYSKALSMDPDDMSTLSEIANAYYNFKRYDQAARTWAKLIALGRNEPKDYLQLGRWYLNAENFKAADSIFTDLIAKNPKLIDAYVFDARTFAKMEGDPKAGTAKPKFEKLLEVAAPDSVKNADIIMEAYSYLAYHYMQNDNVVKSKEFYIKMQTLDPANKDYKTKSYSGLAQVEIKQTAAEKQLDAKLPFLARAEEDYNKILSYDPGNEGAKASLKYIQDYEKSVKAGINPNELRGIIKNSSGQPVGNASVRVKDTAAETYTNSTGAFKFEIPKDSEALIITAQGYKTKEVPVTRPLKPMNIVLEQ
ncbi:MAG TPA: tetratricopeptide repeat protein [Bacteroidales bacterium]|nr:tetratricopeptide repeat protein [Bacteroidales bacterium]